MSWVRKSKSYNSSSSNSFYNAYVVTITKPLVLHMDLHIPSYIKDKYKSVSNTYSYISELKDDIQEGTVYQCRINGIEINDCLKHITIERNCEDCGCDEEEKIVSNIAKDIVIEIKNFLNETNNWVKVKVSEVDSYSRVLVDIYSFDTKKNLASLLLDKGLVKKYIRPDIVSSKPISVEGIVLNIKDI